MMPPGSSDFNLEACKYLPLELRLVNLILFYVLLSRCTDKNLEFLTRHFLLKQNHLQNSGNVFFIWFFTLSTCYGFRLVLRINGSGVRNSNFFI